MSPIKSARQSKQHFCCCSFGMSNGMNLIQYMCFSGGGYATATTQAGMTPPPSPARISSLLIGSDNNARASPQRRLSVAMTYPQSPAHLDQQHLSNTATTTGVPMTPISSAQHNSHWLNRIVASMPENYEIPRIDDRLLFVVLFF